MSQNPNTNNYVMVVCTNTEHEWFRINDLEKNFTNRTSRNKIADNPIHLKIDNIILEWIPYD